MMRWLGLVVALLLPQTGATIAGVVVDAGTKSALTNARIVLVHVEGKLTDSRVATAGLGGAFTFRDVPPGTYRVFAERDDYMRREYDRRIVIAADKPAEPISVALTRLGVISGRVLTEFGEPASGIYVRALTTVTVRETRSNDTGEYRLAGLAPGSYVVSAERYLAPRIGETPQVPGPRYIVPTPPCPDCRGEGQSMMSLTSLLAQGAFIDPRALTGETSPAVFYPGVTDRAAAQTIDVRSGGEISGIDLRLVVKNQ